MSIRIGVVAEEQNDVDVLYELTSKITAEQNFSFRKFLGHGCGKLRRKCSAWANNLVKRGCSHLVVMHDLDQNDEKILRDDLENSIRDIAFTGYLILIPIKALEAWLLYDPAAIKKAFSMGRIPRITASPELINDPKQYLRDIVWRRCGKRYANTIHNRKIAAELKIETLSSCRSFLKYPLFIANAIK